MSSLASITRDSVLKAVAEFDELGRAQFLNRYGFGPARQYFLVIDGRAYDSKAIVGAAYGYEHPKPLTAADFTGGEATVKRRLEALGFQVLLRDGDKDIVRASRAQELWTIDEYLLVGDLYLRRGRTVGTRDAEVQELAKLLGRSPASISRRVGNFHGTEYPGRGLKPITGDALTAWNAFKHSQERRAKVAEVRARLSDQKPIIPRFVPPEKPSVEPVEVVTASAIRTAVKIEAELVRSFRSWLDPRERRLTGIEVPIPGAGTLRVDLFDRDTNTLIEAKAAATRNHLRLAIGQLLDYSRYLKEEPFLAVLTPTKPTDDLMGLLRLARASAVWREENGFADSAGRLVP